MKKSLNIPLNIIFAVLCAIFSSCASTRKPIPIGVVPTLANITDEDRRVCNEVYQGLKSKHPLSLNTSLNERARSLVKKLTSFRNDLNSAVWRVTVLEGGDFANAAATKGNCVFVYAGLMRLFPNNDELSTVLAHEIGHVLAGHATPDASEVVGQILTQVAGSATGQVVSRSPAAIGANIAAGLVTEALKAVVVNPNSQRLEYEADQIGLFLMADAGFNPQHAVTFWEKSSKMAQMSSGMPEIFSSHPSSKNRVANIKRLLPQAIVRYQRSRKI